MNRRRFLAAAPIAAGVLAAAVACGPNGSGAGPLPSVFTPDPSYSAQASAAASAASQVAAKCQPKGESTQAWEVSLVLHKSARTNFYTCEKIPKGDDDAVAACALTAAEKAHKATGASAARETGFITALAACVNTLGASPSSTATVTATPAPSASVTR